MERLQKERFEVSVKESKLKSAESPKAVSSMKRGDKTRSRFEEDILAFDAQLDRVATKGKIRSLPKVSE